MCICIDINIFISVCDFSEINVLKQSILHGKSPRAKYRFDIFPIDSILRMLLHKVLHTTQVHSSGNRQQSKYFSCGFFWFIKYACVICTTVFVFRIKSSCVCVYVCVRQRKGDRGSVWGISVCFGVRPLSVLSVCLCACFISVCVWLQSVC